MTVQFLRPLAILAASTILVAACGGSAAPSVSPPASEAPSPTPPASTPAPTPSSAAAILRITTEGGFIAPAASLAALPAVTVYEDGRIFTPGAVPAIYPGPLVSPVSVRDVGPAGATAIVAAIRAAGLDRPSTAGPGIGGDTGATVFTVTLDGATVTTRFAGLGAGPGTPGDAGSDPARAAALDLLTRLTDPGVAWGATSAATTVYQATAWRIFVAPGAPATDAGVDPQPIAWPLATPLESFGTAAAPDRGIAGLRMGVVAGADAARLAPVLGVATQITPFTSGGRSYTLYVRPLLPDELGG